MTCPVCQTENSPQARFCMACGSALRAPAPPPAPPPAAVRDGVDDDDGFRVMPVARTLAEPPRPPPPPVLIAAPPRPATGPLPPRPGTGTLPPLRPAEGERKYLTIMFADVAGSAAMTAAMSPNTARDILGAAVARMAAQVERFGGTVNQALGDGLLAFFGAPVAHEDDAERAVRAAWEIQREMAAFGAGVAARWGYQDFGARVAVNTGLVVLDEIGSDTRVRYTAIGDAVNLAARLQSAAAPGAIVLSDSAYELARACCTARDLGGLALKGERAPVPAYLVTGLQESGERSHSLTSPMVGREAEMAGLQAQWAAARAGAGQIAVALGEVGLGKTRLLREFTAWVASAGGGGAVLQARCQSYRTSWSYGALITMLRRLWGVGDGASEAETLAAIRSALTALLGPAAGETLPHIAVMFSLPFDDPVAEQLRNLPAKSLQTEIFSAVERVFRALLARGPVLLTVDNAHWADPTSIELLRSLLPLLPTAPLLIFLLAWPDQAPLTDDIAAEHGARARTYRLTPLSVDESGLLMENLLGSHPLPPALGALRAQVRQQVAGNPFYLQEVLHNLIEAGILARTPAGWALTQAVGEIQIPGSLRAVLQARIDRLDEEPRRLLQLAAVIGRGFSRALLLAVTPEPDRLDRDLAALEASDLISPRPEPGEPAYVFNQGLTRDVAYSSVLLRRRRELHGRLGAIIEAQAAADPTGAYALLAYHYDLSEHAGKAVEYLLLAGAQAQALYANEEALGLLRRALARLSAPGAPARPEQVQRVRTQLGEVCEAGGDLAEAETHYRAALALAPTGREQAHLYGRIATTWGWRGDDAQAEAAIRSGLALLAADPDPVETARLRRMEATLKLQTGAYDEAIALIDAATPVLRAAGALAELERALRILGLAYQLQGQMRPASDALRQALAAAQQRGDPVSAALAHNSLAWLYLQAGDLRPALSHLGEARAILEARNLRKELPPIYNSLGDAYRATGQPAPAAAFYGQGRDLAAGAGQALELGQALCGLATLALDTGDPARAAALLAETAPLIGADKELAAQYHLAHGRLLLADGATGEAERAARAAAATEIPLAQAAAERLLGQVAAARGAGGKAAGLFASSRRRLEQGGARLELAHTLAAAAAAGVTVDGEAPVALRARADALYTACGAAPPPLAAPAAR